MQLHVPVWDLKQALMSCIFFVSVIFGILLSRMGLCCREFNYGVCLCEYLLSWPRPDRDRVFFCLGCVSRCCFYAFSSQGLGFSIGSIEAG